MDALRPHLDAIRAELGIAAEWPAEVLAEAEAAAARTLSDLPDERAIPLVTIDPAGSRDLDQALHIERAGDGFRFRYAIADVAIFVAPGGAIDREAHARGETIYLPGERVPLHPPALSEGAASLLPEQDRPAFLWTFELGSDGRSQSTRLERALVRSTRQLDYEQAQAEAEQGGDTPLALLAELGPLRQAIERERGGVGIDTPDQEVIQTPEGGFALDYREQLPIEGWNAQLSLLTGMACAELMLKGGAGVLRTMPDPPPGEVERLRRTARGLCLDWPAEMDYPEFIRTLDQSVPTHAAMLRESTALLRGAGYTSFDGEPPEQREHSAIASAYAHTTAPLRRLVDRYALGCALAAQNGERPPAWVLEALPTLPETMKAADRRARAAERAVIDVVEASLLEHRVGEEFAAVVVDVDERRPGRATVQLADPPVIGRVTGDRLELGAAVRVTLTAAAPRERRVEFALG